MYSRTGYCLPLIHLRHQHVSICLDVVVRTVTLYTRDSKLNANPHVTLGKCDDAPKYGRTQQMLEILRAGRAYGNPKIRSTTIFKICKHDSTRYLRHSISKLSTEILCCTCQLHSHLHFTSSGYQKISPSYIFKCKPTQGAFSFTRFTRSRWRIHF
jgi:hypothetical protein